MRLNQIKECKKTMPMFYQIPENEERRLKITEIGSDVIVFDESGKEVFLPPSLFRLIENRVNKKQNGLIEPPFDVVVKREGSGIETTYSFEIVAPSTEVKCD